MKFEKLIVAAAVLSLLVAASLFAAPKAVVTIGVAADNTKHEITAQELKQRIEKGEKVVIVDARHDLNGQIIKSAVHVPMDKLEEWAKGIDKKMVIVTYCTCPHDEAAEAEVKSLQDWGYANAYSLKGGMNAAREAGLEIVAPTGEAKAATAEQHLR
jgi:rhodanese-related sulfurtransferase